MIQPGSMEDNGITNNQLSIFPPLQFVTVFKHNKSAQGQWEGSAWNILFCYLLNDEIKLKTIQTGIFTIASEEGTVTEVLAIVMNI